MTKLARRTHIPVKWTLDVLAPITHDGRLLLARRLIAALKQGRRGQNLALGPPSEPALERFRRCEQSAWNGAGDDTGGSLAS